MSRWRTAHLVRGRGEGGNASLNVDTNCQIQGSHSNPIFKFPVFSMSEWKFSLCQFQKFVPISYVQLALRNL